MFWGRASERNFVKMRRVLERFLAEGLPERLRGLGSSELVDFQFEAVGRDKFLVLRALQDWVNGLDLRAGSKKLYYT